jgi:hypothetical protein
VSGQDDVGGYGGPSDDGVGMAAWLMAQALDDAREEYVAATELPTLLEVLLAALSAPESGGVR